MSSKTLKTYLEYKVMILWSVGFTVLLSYNIYSYRKNLLDYTNLFFPNDYKKNYKIVNEYFKDKYGMPWLYTKNRWNKKLSFRRNKTWFNDLMSEKHKRCTGLWITLIVLLFSFLLPVVGSSIQYGIIEIFCTLRTYFPH